jgi:hypothetical protein
MLFNDIINRFRVYIRPAAVARLVAASGLVAMGAVHIQQYIVQDYRLIPTIGPLFLLNFIAGTALGLYFVVPVGRRAGRIRLRIDALAALGGWLLAAGALAALLVSEHTPLFGFMEHGYRFAIVFSIAAEAVALVALTVLLVLLVLGRPAANLRRSPRRRPHPTPAV